MQKKGDGRRVERVEKEIHAILSRYLASSYKGDLPGIVTITYVQMPPDLRAARVSVAVLGGNAEANQQAAQMLQDRAADMQAYLAKNLPMRYTAKLKFVADESLEKVLKVDRLLKEISDKKDPSED